MGLRMGSGSIESAIRPVVNLRMKNNGAIWRLAKVESMLVLRSSILSGPWDVKDGNETCDTLPIDQQEGGMVYDPE